MEMEIAVVENLAHVKLRGRLDTHGVDQIETKLTASLVPGGRNAVVDLSELRFVASMGLRMFIVVKKALTRHGAKMVLFAPHPQVSEVFATASLAAIISIVHTETEAIASIKA